MHTFRKLFPATALVLGLAVASCASDKAVIHQANTTHAELEPAIMKDPELSGYLEEVGMRIVAAAREADRERAGPDSHFDKDEDNAWMFNRGQFHLVNSKTLNAFTTGGEHMYIFSELMQQCRTEDELAAVMAHEYAHVYSRHVHKGINRQMGILGAAALAGVVGVVVGGDKHGEDYGKIAFASTAVIGNVLGMGYTRDDEGEADKYGFDFYTRAGWDPDRFGDFFQQLIDKGYDKTPEEESDHPSLSSRVADAKQRTAALPPEAAAWRRPPVAGPSEFAALQNRSVQVAATMPTTEQLAMAQTLLDAVPTCVAAEDPPRTKQAQQTLLRAYEGGTSSAPAQQ